MSRLIRPHLPALQKTASYYVLHITVAAMVAYAVTGNFWVALTLSLLEPSVQAVAFFFHEKLWERRRSRPGLARTRERRRSKDRIAGPSKLSRERRLGTEGPG